MLAFLALVLFIGGVGLITIISMIGTSLLHLRPNYDENIDRIWYLTSEILDKNNLRHDYLVESEFKADLRPALVDNYPLELTANYPCSSKYINCSELSSLQIVLIRSQIFYNFKREDIFLAQNKFKIKELADELILELSIASLNPNKEDKDLVNEVFELLKLVESN